MEKDTILKYSSQASQEFDSRNFQDFPAHGAQWAVSACTAKSSWTQGSVDSWIFPLPIPFPDPDIWSASAACESRKPFLLQSSQQTQCGPGGPEKEAA